MPKEGLGEFRLKGKENLGGNGPTVSYTVNKCS